ncbi:MAG TPA: type II toxin-antitoxin system RelE/ParE family toxin [Acidobacteriaceae bacterium]|nr:type II toxin-antitoxin system RelE/ParE family toxin [Acidobacteriaceae bacterium]
MNGWTLQISSYARKQYRLLGAGPKAAAKQLLEDLAEEPASVPAIELRGKPGVWRARFHTDYRMVFEISKAEKRIRVTRIEHRATVYEGMKR